MSHFKQKIEDNQKALDVLRGNVAELMGMAEAEERDLSDSESLQLEAYTNDVSRLEKRGVDLARAEQSMAERVIEKQSPAIITGGMRDIDRKPGDIFFKQVAAAYVAHVNKLNPLEVAKAAWPNDRGIEAVIKTGIDPANTTVSGWASQLVESSLQGYQDLLRGASIAAQLWAVAGMNVNFDGFQSIVIPARAGTKTDLASGWTGESQAIPVRRATFSSQTMSPYKWGAITVTSKELVTRSMPSIMAILQKGIIDDTASKLDVDFFDSTAAAAGLRPAGIFNGVTGTAASVAGPTAADDILADIRNLLNPIYAANMGTTMRIVMHPTNALAMSTTLANGAYIFRDELANGRIFNVPVIQSTNASLTEIWAFDMAEQAIAQSAPVVTVSDSATLVMVNDDGVAPAMGAQAARNPSGQVLGATGANSTTPVSPTRSLFQTEDVAIKSTQFLSWKTLRTGSVNKITGVSW
jgi:hypothetical protein